LIQVMVMILSGRRVFDWCLLWQSPACLHQEQCNCTSIAGHAAMRMTATNGDSLPIEVMLPWKWTRCQAME
jgi:hypothetical protein